MVSLYVLVDLDKFKNPQLLLNYAGFYKKWLKIDPLVMRNSRKSLLPKQVFSNSLSLMVFNCSNLLIVCDISGMFLKSLCFSLRNKSGFILWTTLVFCFFFLKSIYLILLVCLFFPSTSGLWSSFRWLHYHSTPRIGLPPRMVVVETQKKLLCLLWRFLAFCSPQTLACSPASICPPFLRFHASPPLTYLL